MGDTSHDLNQTYWHSEFGLVCPTARYGKGDGGLLSNEELDYCGDSDTTGGNTSDIGALFETREVEQTLEGFRLYQLFNKYKRHRVLWVLPDGVYRVRGRKLVNTKEQIEGGYWGWVWLENGVPRLQLSVAAHVSDEAVKEALMWCVAERITHLVYRESGSGDNATSSSVTAHRAQALEEAARLGDATDPPNHIEITLRTLMEGIHYTGIISYDGDGGEFEATLCLTDGSLKGTYTDWEWWYPILWVLTPEEVAAWVQEEHAETITEFLSDHPDGGWFNLDTKRCFTHAKHQEATAEDEEDSYIQRPYPFWPIPPLPTQQED